MILNNEIPFFQQTKKCTKCEEEKSAYLDFSPNKPVCKKCANIYKRKYLNGDPSMKWSNTSFFVSRNGRKDLRDHILDV